jgi:hypothetical protein
MVWRLILWVGIIAIIIGAAQIYPLLTSSMVKASVNIKTPIIVIAVGIFLAIVGYLKR